MKRFFFKSKCFYIIHLFSVLLHSPSVWTASVSVTGDETVKNVDLLMPDVQPKVADSYLCYAMKVDSPFYIIGFQPKAKMEISHHMLLYGCASPGSTQDVWDCGEMHANQFEQAPVCQDGMSIIYAWAMDAPALQLPEGVGFKVGAGSSIKYIVLQIHYKNVDPFLPPNNERDHSGVTLITTENKQPRRAGVYIMGTMGKIAPHSTTYMETACSFNEQIELHLFAYRTHAHSHGKVVSGYRVRNGEWTEIGRKSPQLPQMFYNVTHPGMTVTAGDMLAARCTMVNDDNSTVSIGDTSKDEMCNFYMMYYVDGDQLADEDSCFSQGPPRWNWSLLRDLHHENAPLNASIIPGTTELLQSTQKFFKDVEDSMDRERQNMESRIEGILNALQDYKRYADIDDSPDDNSLVNEINAPYIENDNGLSHSSYDSSDVEDNRY